jgi:hypothetical protein
VSRDKVPGSGGLLIDFPSQATAQRPPHGIADDVVLKKSVSMHSKTPSRAVIAAGGGKTVDDWLKLAIIAVFFLLLIVGSIPILRTDGKSPLTLNSFTPLVPAIFVGICIVLQQVAHSFGFLIRTHGFPIVLMLLAFIFGGIFLILGMRDSNESNKSAYFGFAGTFLGFALGVPVGNIKRKDRENDHE